MDWMGINQDAVHPSVIIDNISLVFRFALSSTLIFRPYECETSNEIGKKKNE